MTREDEVGGGGIGSSTTANESGVFSVSSVVFAVAVTVSFGALVGGGGGAVGGRSTTRVLGSDRKDEGSPGAGSTGKGSPDSSSTLRGA
jgi:hypothetical protein